MAEPTRSTASPDAVVAPVTDTVPKIKEWRRPPFGKRLAHALSFRNISAIYLFIAMFVIFSLWVPQTFLTPGVWTSLLANQSITCLIAIALVLPLASGVFDLAIGSEVGLGAILVAWLLATLQLPAILAILLTLAAGALIGVVITFLIVRVRISSFVATLGMGSVLAATISWISNSQQITGVPREFGELASGRLFGITHSVFIMLIVAFIVWYVLERTSAGRRVYATGGNIEAEKLAGVRTTRVILASTIACGMIAGLAGILLTSQLTVGDPTTGPGYLMPAFAAAVLGSTQLKNGRYNVWGTVIAAYVLATGVKGLQLAGAPVWIPELFNGIALLVAVGMAQHQKAVATGRRSWFRMLTGRKG